MQYRENYEVPTICNMCPSRCMIIGKVRQGRLIKIEGNPKGPFNGAKICAKAHAAIKLLYDPDRLKYPLKRTGERGEGKWTRISWNEAIDTISMQMEKGLNRYGPQSLALFSKGPSSVYIRELFEELSVTNLNDSSYDQSTAGRDLAYRLTFGIPPGRPERVDLKNTKCVVLIGTHLGENVDVVQMRDLMDGLARGVKLIVVDPRLSVIASKANHHLMIRPGTDTALLLGWINYIIGAKLYDKKYILDNVEGFKPLKEHAADYSIEMVSKITDIPADEIRKTAKLIASCAPMTVIHPGRHSAWYGNDVQRLRAQAILTGLLGTWGQKGGIFLPTPLPSVSPDQQETENDLLQLPGIRASSLIKNTLNKKIRLLGCWGQNPFHAYPNPYRTAAAFKKAEFVFTCDVLPTEPALFADIILPEATFLERSDIIETWTDSDPVATAIRYPVVTTSYEAKDPYWIVKQLSSRLGKGKGFQFNNVLERLETELAGMELSVNKLFKMGGVATFPAEPFKTPTDEQPVDTWQPLTAVLDAIMPQETPRLMEETPSSSLFGKAQEENGISPIMDFTEPSKNIFPTPSGKIEFFSRTLEANGIAPLPKFTPVHLPPPGYARLIYGRSPVHTLTSTMNNRWLNHEIDENEMWLNDRVAGRMRIMDGDELFLENQDGFRSIQPVKIKVTPGIRVDCVYMAHGFGSRSPHLNTGFLKGVSDAFIMTRSGLDPVSGCRGMRINFVRFVKKGKTLDIPMLDHPPAALYNRSG